MRFVWMFVTAGLGLAQSPQYHGVATTKQLMAAIEKPSMDAIGALSKAGGPKDDKEWEAAQRQAAVLAEGAQLLTMGNRSVDADAWVKSSQRLEEAATVSAKAAEAKDLDAWKASIGNIGAACKGCHSAYRKPKAQ